MAVYNNTCKKLNIMVKLLIPYLGSFKSLKWVGISLVNFSSNTSNGLNCSTFYLNANNATSNANANIDSGTLLNMYKYVNRAYSLLVVGKTNNKISLSVGSINTKALR
jgi:hypothetical protein